MASLKMVMQGLQTLLFSWTVLTGKINVRASKMIAPSWLKVVCPVADGKDLATRGMSISLFFASLLMKQWTSFG